MRRLLPTALTLALVQSMTIASLGKTFAKRHNYMVNSNHELVAVGASNLMGSFFSALPVSGSFSRSVAAEHAMRIDNILILRVDASLSFINADFFRDFILEKSSEKNDTTQFVVVDGSSINMLDTTAIDSLQSVTKTLEGWEMELYITGLKGPVRDVIRK
jgi:MFS superfamily sulfate permease-like transporter